MSSPDKKKDASIASGVAIIDILNCNNSLKSNQGLISDCQLSILSILNEAKLP